MDYIYQIASLITEDPDIINEVASDLTYQQKQQQQQIQRSMSGGKLKASDMMLLDIYKKGGMIPIDDNVRSTYGKGIEQMASGKNPLISLVATKTMKLTNAGIQKAKTVWAAKKAARTATNTVTRFDLNTKSSKATLTLDDGSRFQAPVSYPFLQQLMQRNDPKITRPDGTVVSIPKKIVLNGLPEAIRNALAPNAELGKKPAQKVPAEHKKAKR